MSDVKEQDRSARSTLTRGSSGRVELKRTVESGMVRQSFSHGRSKSVAVEVKKRRSLRGPAALAKGAEGGKAAAAEAAPKAGTARGRAADAARSPVVLKALTEEEKIARKRALADARVAEEEARKRAEAEAKRHAEEEARRKAEDEAAAKRKAEEDARRHSEDEARRKAEEQAAKLLAEEERRREEEEREAAEAEAAEEKAEKEAAAAKEAEAGKPEAEEDEERRERGRGKERGKAARPERRGAPRRDEPRRGGRIVLDSNAEVIERRGPSLAAWRRHREREKRQASAPTEPVVREVVLPETITVQELASRMAVRGAEVVKALMRMGVMATITQTIDTDTAELVVGEFGHTVKRVSEADVEEGLGGPEDRPEDLVARAPIVTVMGHVDHGKTSLLDALRSADVAANEAGGITQHIGAYQVDVGAGVPVTFIDTPGHAAFTAMRARGAQITDLVVLVVAADDGVMPQTVEAIRHAQAAKVPIVVAINKMDVPDADPTRVKNELLNHDLVPEDFGGDVLCVEVSAVAKTGLDTLIETLQLQAEILELKADPDRDASGAVIEARLERGRGAVTTVLVQRGTLRVGDIVVCGPRWGRARALINDRGEQVSEAGPSVPVEILGLDGVPEAGDPFVVVESERRAREVTAYRQRKQRDQAVAAQAPRSSLEAMFEALKTGEIPELPVVVKADVHGSLEAIIAGLENLSGDEATVRVLHGAVGGITESDVTLAAASKAVIIGFNVRANAQAREAARRDHVELRYYSIIYELLDEMKAALGGLLAPVTEEAVLGRAEIREIFSVSKIGKIAGCRVIDGLIRRNARARLIRDDVVIHDGALGSLKRFKDDAREVKEGFECGMTLEGYNDIRQGDVIEAYEIKEVERVGA